MRYALIATAGLLLLFWFVLPSILFPYAHHGAGKAELYPPFLAPRTSGPLPTFADVQKKAARIDALRRSDRCIDAAYAAGEKNLNAFDKVARFGGFMKCYVGELELYPRRLCADDKRQELARYTRGYFYELGLAKEVSEKPALKGRLELPPEIRSQIDPQSDIIAGYLDFAPDPTIVDGWKNLIKVGVFAKGEALQDLLAPEVPADVIRQLSAVPLVYQYCQ